MGYLDRVNSGKKKKPVGYMARKVDIPQPKEDSAFSLDTPKTEWDWRAFERSRLETQKKPASSISVKPTILPKPKASTESPFTSGFKKLLGYSDALQKPIETGITLGLNKLGESIGGTVGGYLRRKLFNESSMETQQKNEALQNLDAEIERGVNPTFRTGADIVGTVLGMASPVNAAYKLTGNLAAKGLSRLPIKGKATERLVKGGAAGLGYSTARESVDVADDLVSGRELDPVSERAKNIATETALFGGGDLLAYGVGAGIKKAGQTLMPNRFRPTANSAEMLDEVNKAYKQGITEKAEYVRPALPKVQKANTLNKSVLPLNEQVSTKPLRQPLESATGPKERQFAQNVRESNVATNEIKQNLDKNKLTYEPITNLETLDKAKRIVDADVENAKNLFSSSSGGVTADDVALGEALITKAIKDGNSSEANRLIADLAEKLTTAGQAVQAASIFKRLTPEGMLLYAQRVVNNANKALKQRLGKKAPVVKLTEEDSKFILDSMNKVLQLPDGRQKDIEMAKIMQLIANKEPATRSEKIQGIQRVAMLLNPKTMVRNTLGNTIFSVIDNASNVIATPIDKLTGKFTGNRTTTLPSLTGQLKSGLRGVKETIEDARLGVDTYSSGTQYELPSKRIFDTNALNKLDVATRTGLQLGDRPFYKAAYDDALRQQMKLAKTKEPTQDMINQAHAVAQQRTYQDTNAFVDAFRKAQTALNKAGSFVGVGSEKFGLGNVVIPFTKTPANILARAVEYSPVGLQKSIAEATKIGKGTFNQKAFVDSIARSVTGTALIMVGYDLAKKGMITGSSNKDKDVSTFERNLGKNDFAFKVGDKYYTYDWAQPVSMALAVGADIYLKGKDRKEAENVVFDAIKSGGETLFKQSIMQGLQRFMGGYSPIDNLASTAVNAPTQFIPTISKQITQLTDPNSRNVYSTTTPGTALNIAKSKIPGLSKTLEPKVDTFGNNVMNYQGNNSIFNIFFNPGFSTEFKPNETQKEIIRLYDTTGDKDIFPKVAPTSFTYKGEKYTLEPEEITALQRYIGKITEEGFNRIISDPRYSGLSEEGKAKVLAKQIDMAYDKAKQQFLATKLK